MSYPDRVFANYARVNVWVSEWIRIPDNAKYANVRVWHSSCPAEAMLQDVKRVEIIVN